MACDWCLMTAWIMIGVEEQVWLEGRGEGVLENEKRDSVLEVPKRSEELTRDLAKGEDLK